MGKMKSYNVLLLEKMDESSLEVYEDEKNDSSNFLSAKGIKIFKVIQPIKDGFETIIQHDPQKNIVDISPLSKKSGYYMVSVDKDEYNNFFWTCFVLGDYMTSDCCKYGLITMREPIRKCTDEEVALLNKVFPEYLANAY